MRVLVTGGFGNIGKYVVEELLKEGFNVRIFDLKTKKNLKLSRKIRGVEFYWGDITNKMDAFNALKDVDYVIHLAFIIPKISSTEINIEKQPEIAEKINIVGTKNLIESMKELKYPDKIIFTSSVHIYGITQHLPPPRKIEDELKPNDLYSYHKFLCEKLIKESGLKYIIMRLGASITIDLKIINFIRDLFEVPLDNRIEYIHPKDIAFAIVNAIKKDSLWNKIFNIGGGKTCQYIYKDFVTKILEAIGIGMLPENLFSKTYFAVDFLDTEESEKLLNYQKRDLNDYIIDLKKKLGLNRYFIKLLKPFIRYYIISKSPYFVAKWSFKNFLLL